MVAHIQSGPLGRSWGDLLLNGKAKKTSGTRKRRCIERWMRGSKTP
jgi:hypothetical protein